jgi:hypothetical protein
MTDGERLRETSAASAPAAAVPVDLDLLHRVEANMEWLVAAARPHCGSEPESYGISDAEDGSPSFRASSAASHRTAGWTAPPRGPGYHPTSDPHAAPP